METKQYTLTGVWRNTTDKAGNPLKSKDGKPYTKVSIKTKETGDKYVGGFGNKANEGWKIGDVVDIIVEQNGDFLNFKLPNKDDAQNERIAKLESRVMKLELAESRMMEKITAEVKSALMLEFGGKFQTTADFKKQQEPHPLYKSSNPLDGMPPDDVEPF